MNKQALPIDTHIPPGSYNPNEDGGDGEQQPGAGLMRR